MWNIEQNKISEQTKRTQTKVYREHSSGYGVGGGQNG